MHNSRLKNEITAPENEQKRKKPAEGDVLNGAQLESKNENQTHKSHPGQSRNGKCVTSDPRSPAQQVAKKDTKQRV